MAGVIMSALGGVLIYFLISAINNKKDEREEKRSQEVNELTNQGDEEFDSKNFTNAVEYYSKALKMDQYNISALEGIALTYHIMGNYETSKEYIKEYQSLFPKKLQGSVTMAYLCGHFCYMEGDLEQASNYKKRAIELASGIYKSELDRLNKLNLY